MKLVKVLTILFVVSIASVSKGATLQQQTKNIKSNDITDALNPNSDKTIFLKSRKFIPVRGIDPTLNISHLPKRPHLFIQFDHIPNTEERALLKELGVNLHSYFHYNVWAMSLDKLSVCIPAFGTDGLFWSHIRSAQAAKEAMDRLSKESPDVTKDMIIKFIVPEEAVEDWEDIMGL